MRMLGIAALVACLFACAQSARAAGLETVLQDDAQLLHRPDDEVRQSLQEMKALGVDRVRVTAGWSVLTRDADSAQRPVFDATDPAAYEQERWRSLDRLVTFAAQDDLKVMIDIAFWAPHWASRDAPSLRGRTDIDPSAYAQFAVAVARRYSGTFTVPQPVAGVRREILPSRDQRYLDAGFGDLDPFASSFTPSGPLPRVDVFTLWNEPNHPSFLRPQWQRVGRHHYVPRSPETYRAMVQQAYPAIKAARPDATVLIGGLSSTGAISDRGKAGVPPLRFLRELACVDEHLRPLRRSGCSSFATVPGDGFAIHPYTMTTSPGAHASPRRPDDVPIADLPKLDRLLGKLVARGRLAPATRNIWVTEYGYETNPPSAYGVSLGTQAYYLTWAEFLASRVAHVRSFAQFLLRDLPPGAFRIGHSSRRAFGQWQSGLETTAGGSKPAVYSFRAGLFAQRLRDGRLRLWGRLRLGDGIRAIVIDRCRARCDVAGHWHTVHSAAPGDVRAAGMFNVSGDDAFERFAAAPPGNGWHYRLRYLDVGTWHVQPAVPVVG